MKGLDKVMGMADEWLETVMKVEDERSNKVMRKLAHEGMEEIQINEGHDHNEDVIIIMTIK